LERRTIDTHGLAPIEKYCGRISLYVDEAASLADGFGEREPPRSKRDLLLGAERAKCQEGLRLAVKVNRIVWMRIDIVDRLVYQRAKRGDSAPALALQDHPHVRPG
jgi:hypothetical protein